MQQSIIGNQFQNHMSAKFNIDLYSSSAIMANVRGKEALVMEYINNIGACFQPTRFDVYGNPNGLYADYATFKKDFVGYWRRALDIARTEAQELEDIFDEAVISQEKYRNRTTTSVFFEDGNALTIDDCLYAIYDVLGLA